MFRVSKESRLASAGYALVAAGVLVFSLLDKISRWRVGADLVSDAARGSLGAMLVGFVLACVGSAMWARRAQTRKPLKLAALVAVAAFGLTWMIGVNIHGSSVILMFVVLFSMINVVVQLIAVRYRSQ